MDLPRKSPHAFRDALFTPLNLFISQIALNSPVQPSIDPTLLHPSRHKLATRQRLEQWNEQFGGPDELALSAFENHPAHGDIQNNLAKLSYGSKADEDLEGNGQMRDHEDEDDELVTIGLFLKPGDVVELSMPGREPVLAVFVQQLDLTSQFYSVNGRWVHSKQGHISFAVPGAINPAALQPLIPYLPTKTEGVLPDHGIQVPRKLGAPVQDLLSQLTEESERIYRTNAPVLDTAYSTLADATRTRMMTLPQIAKTLLGKDDPTWSPSPSALLAVRKALKHNEFRFRSDVHSQRLTNIFAIRPKVDVEMVETVHEWVRDYREDQAALANNENNKQLNRSAGAEYIREFVKKAQRLIAESRKGRQLNHGFVGPDQSEVSSAQNLPGIKTTILGEDFTKTDQQIVSFLQAWVLMDQFASMPNLHSACASILHATGCYNDIDSQNKPFPVMGKSAGHILLQEIGVTTPFENRAIYNENLMLPTVRLSRNLELLNTKAELTRRRPDFQDAMADMRRDWGPLTVYCIDSADAKEIDDGVSIERVHGSPSEYWIHVHVANPTAFFNKSHVLSGLAAHMTESVYTPERSFAMLPSWASQNYFSLANNRPVITFSARIDDSGYTLETKIQHGIIRKVVSITPEELATYLDEHLPGEAKRLVVGGDPHVDKRSRPSPRLAAEQLQNLRDLYAAGQALWKGRQAAGGVRLGRPDKAEVAVYEKPNVGGLTWMPPSIGKSRRVIGDPIIELRGEIPKDTGYFVGTITSSNIVEEMMLLACRTAGSWCAERNIPVMFRGTVESPSAPLPLAQFREQVLFPHLEKNGSLSMRVAQLYLGALGRSIAHSSPIPHHVLGAKAHIKVTSPLRRFSDMIAHWQIEAALRFEARTGQKLDARALAGSPRPILPFSHRQMQESIITLSPRERIIRRAKTHSSEFWAVQAFIRAFYYQEAPLPETFIVRVKRPDPITGSKGFFEGYGMNVILSNSPVGEYQVGDRWEAKINYIDPFKSHIHVDAVRLIHRDEEM
ncbi:3'-5' RNA exonuclease complex component [Didymosphaeria variabile]|uniref:3'-5' RNA exonuclease complex component n=1 Tax=Didymosphaeria variabile TaxID=1932322 RepID=A0A9W8XLK4_9PLEO|nr:3'-5' RNA exonuclease complex component [Didymosphaeria variabile]KAJ4352130.1 3'-5' RNA exonuclease complex component [Didymosphaeria variabile]